MKKFFLFLFGIYFIIGIVVCVVACNTYFKASELEFSAQKAANAVTKVLEVSDTSKIIPDTCKECH